MAAILGADTAFLKPAAARAGAGGDRLRCAAGEDINRVLNQHRPAEVLLAMPDSAVYNTDNVRNILLSTYRHKQGVIGFSADMVKAGALATTYSEIEDIDAQVAEIGARLRQHGGELPRAPVPALLPHHRQRRRGALARPGGERRGAQFRAARTARRRHERPCASGRAGASASAWSSSPCCRWCFLFSSFVWYSWYSHRAQVDEELAERGRILARALAETSEYNVISGNLSDLRLTINGLVQSDKSIYRIDVVDAAAEAGRQRQYPVRAAGASPASTRRRSRSR